jgi:hypothetical protein
MHHIARHFDAGALQSRDQHRRRVLKHIHARVQLHRFAIRQTLGAIELA